MLLRVIAISICLLYREFILFSMQRNTFKRLSTPKDFLRDQGICVQVRMCVEECVWMWVFACVDERACECVCVYVWVRFPVRRNRK